MTISNKNNITKRSDKSSPLTHDELDRNFDELGNVIDDASANENALQTHENAADPHPQYATDVRVDDIVQGNTNLSSVSVTSTTGTQTISAALDDRVEKGEVGSESVATATGMQTVVQALDQRGPVFDNVADMNAATGLTVGIKCRTLGYYAPGDGGGNDYEIVAAATGADDGGSFIDLAGSGTQAKGRPDHILQWGVSASNDAQVNTPLIQSAIDYSVGNSLSFKGAGVVSCNQLTVIGPITLESDKQSGLDFSSEVGNLFSVSGENLNILNMYCTNSGRPQAGFISSGSGGVVGSSVVGNEVVGFGQGISINGEGDAGIDETYTISDAYGGTYETSYNRSHNLIQGNTVRDTLASESIGVGGPSIYIRGGYWRVIGNRVENMQGGIFTRSIGGGSVIAGNVVLRVFGDNGIYATNANGVVITGNYVEGAGTDGIAFNTAERVTCTGNTVVRARNSAFRLQASHNILISGNTVIGPSNSYLRTATTDEYPPMPSNINVVGNSFSGGMIDPDVTNPFSLGLGSSWPEDGQAHKNWRISGNIISDVDTRGLVGSFFGPYSIINFPEASIGNNNIVSGNTFTNVEDIPLSANNVKRFFRCDKEYGNTISLTNDVNLDSIHLSGSARINFSGGAPNVGYLKGFITNLSEGSNIGEYIVTLDRPRSIDGFTWSASEDNAPKNVQMSVHNPQSGNDASTSFTITLLDASGSPFSPATDCFLSFEMRSYESHLKDESRSTL